MKATTEVTLRNASLRRTKVLASLGSADKTRLLELLLQDFFVDQRATLLRWSALTGQSAQIDTGYVAQHVASVALAIPGQGFRGKGKDLIDGSEVKSAATLSGVDRPRWNHNCGKPSDDENRRSRGLKPAWEEYLAAPYFFYLLFDRPFADGSDLEETRIRSWLIDAQRDKPWRDLVCHFASQRKVGQYNLQLHPPVGYDDSVVVNTLGNLNFAERLCFDVRVLAGPGNTTAYNWITPLGLPDELSSSRALNYGGRRSRPTRIEGLPTPTSDLSRLQQLIPEFDDSFVRVAEEEQQLDQENGDPP